MEKNLNKIHIIGSVGSGKTTLARNLSSQLRIPHYELDNVVWKKSENGDIRRTEQERDNYLSSIVQSKQWTIEGVHHKWVGESFHEADLIIFLDTPYSIRNYRIIKRFFLQKIGAEKANYIPTFQIFKRMFVWNKNYENIEKPEILNMLTEYNHKLVILKDNKEIKKLLGGERL
ncbi:P-loop NTPase family protein [Pontibacillus marinus]|uniref:DNA topology modulation protein FlaR n=1 Tax=Pontibacillus marinus BH030004 = DSM 16465 TaxID=1385511 RepID=A0A0A5G392_9BACI|nr:AAA family ATPase [Pontibacillus marinus]KGX85608.1 DNA topology modulation protein FlaR [Pontibacillus marinus BH030004 = DSM 16465]